MAKIPVLPSLSMTMTSSSSSKVYEDANEINEVGGKGLTTTEAGLCRKQRQAALEKEIDSKTYGTDGVFFNMNGAAG